ncbi:MAG TPA: hypothetical protein VMG10_27360 [Gemmataceae bacterium]|nr:hypothetical protein [Gemmataceae bacterium]
MIGRTLESRPLPLTYLLFLADLQRVMIGQTLESRPLPPLGGTFWLLAASALDVAAVAAGNVHLAVASVLPWLVAVLFFRLRERPFTARLTETALEVEEPPLELRYDDLQGLLAPRRPANPFKAGPRSYLIQVIHRNGILRIPARLNVPSDDVFSFFYSRFSPSGSRDVPSTLLDFLRHRERRFGPDQVLSYRRRDYLGLLKALPRLRACFLALMLAGAAWLIWGIVSGQTEWTGGGVVTVVLGGLFSLLFWLDGRRYFGSARKGRQAGLVVAPDGLALVQGDLVGELRWDEVLEVKLGRGPATFQFSTSTQPPRGIVLAVEGAAVVITDIYDRPISLIYQNICHYWRGKSRDADSDGDAKPHLPVKQIRSAVPESPRSSSAEGITPPE